MKWMWSSAVVVCAVSVVLSAQSNDAKMTSTMSREYTGCLEVVNHGGSLLLTHLNNEMTMHDDGMKNDADHMMPDSVALNGRVNLKKHVGQKVTVTGPLSHGMAGTMRNDR